MLTLRNVNYAPVLKSLTLSLEWGKSYALTGPSGCGKTTLLKLAAGLILPDAGEIFFKGRNLSELCPMQYRYHNAYLPQSPAFFSATVKETLLWPFSLKVHQRQELPSERALKQSLEQVFLDQDLNRSTETLSGGEKQRLALARIFLLKPGGMIFLDEPASALDSETGAKVMKNLFEIFSRQTILCITHDPSAASRMDYCIEFEGPGKLKNTSAIQGESI